MLHSPNKADSLMKKLMDLFLHGLDHVIPMSLWSHFCQVWGLIWVCQHYWHMKQMSYDLTVLYQHRTIYNQIHQTNMMVWQRSTYAHRILDYHPRQEFITYIVWTLAQSCTHYCMVGYFQGFKILWIGKLRQFCGFIFSWRTYSNHLVKHVARIQ